MLGNYFKMARRSLIKNKLSALINIFGLTIGLATGMVSILMIKNEFDHDRFHKNLSSIHVLMINQQNDGRIVTGQSLPGPLAAVLRNQVPEIQYVARYGGISQQLLAYKGKSIYEQGLYAEPDLFKILQFEALKGNPVAALQEAGGIVITAQTAKKLFGDEAPIGKIIRYNNQHDVKVEAVIRDIPRNSSLYFNAVQPFRSLEQENKNMFSKWDNYVIGTFL